MNEEKLALSIAIKAYEGIKDLAGKPIIDHVFRMHSKFTGEGLFHSKVRTVVLLHEILEDVKGWNEEVLRSLFSKDVVDAVVLLTHKKDVQYNLYIHNLKSNNLARVVKLSDLEDNMDISRLPRLKEIHLQRLAKYHRSYVTLTSYTN